MTALRIRMSALYNKNIRKWSRTASTISLCWIKFFYSHTLEKEWTTFTLVRLPKENKSPPILSSKEVRRIFNRIYTTLPAAYSAQRLSKGAILRFSDVQKEKTVG